VRLRTRRRPAPFLLLLGAVACGSESGSAPQGAPPVVWADTSYGGVTVQTTPLREVTTPGALSDRDLREASGAVWSPREDGTVWSINDSGNEPWLFALDSTGASRGVVQVAGASNRDWEALAAGPCPTGVCLYIGDVGDNLARYRAVTVWRIPEPMAPGPGTRTQSVASVALHFTYPGGPRDVEAMWVDPDTALWLATKRPLRGNDGTYRPSLLYRLPPSAWNSPDTAIAELVDSLPNVPRGDRAALITDAALSNPLGTAGSGNRLAVRTYQTLFVFRVAERSGRPLLLEARCDLAPLNESQGEGLTWLPDGRVLLLSEDRGAPIRAGRCP